MVVRNQQVLGLGQDGPARQFLERVFRVAEVDSIELDRLNATARIRPDRPPADPMAFLARLALALRETGGPIAALPRVAMGAAVTIHRHRDGGLLTTCEVLVDRPGWLRINHPALRQDPVVARGFERLMAEVPGVVRTARDGRSGAINVRFDRAQIAAPRLIRMAEEVLDAPGWWVRMVPAPPRTSFALANTNLAVGAAADLALPALAPVSALMLLGGNLRTFRLAWDQVRNRTLGLPVLYSLIVGGTLASGQFLASALMSWSFKFWHDRLRQDLSAERRRLLADCLPLPELARLATPGGEVLAPVDRLAVGDRVIVGPSDLIPADGRVAEGEAMIDEQALRGVTGASRVRPGDDVLAGSTVLQGTLSVAVTRPFDRARASSIGRALLSATSPDPGVSAPTRDTEQFAERAIVPTMAAAGVGLLAGDLSTATAILRPDYATGPGVSAPLNTVRDATACARLGIVVRSADALDRLAGVHRIVLDDAPSLRDRGFSLSAVRSRLPDAIVLRYAASAFRHLADERAEALLDACRERRCHVLDLPAVAFDAGVTVEHGGRRVRVRELDDATPSSQPRNSTGPLAVEVDDQLVAVVEFARSERPRAARAVELLRQRPGVSVVLLSDRPEHEAAELAQGLGVQEFHAALSPDRKAEYLRGCRRQAVPTAFVGDCRAHPAAAAAAGITITTAGDTLHDDHPGDVVLLQPRIELVADLHEVARSHATRVRAEREFVILPNALCVAGALFFGLTALTVVIVSNLSTLGLYRHVSDSLQAPALRGRPRPRRILTP